MRPVSKTLRNITIAAALMTLIILATCWDARAENIASDGNYPYLEYRGIVTIDENGTQVNNQTYFLHCGGNSYSVEVKITWSNGVAEIVKIVNGCEALWYVAVTDSNDVELAEVVAATTDVPETVEFVYLPLVTR